MADQEVSFSELVRRIENVVRFGTVTDVDHGRALCRVQVGDMKTEWRPWLTQRAGAGRRWWPPTAGEQCVLLSPGGELASAFVLPGVFSDEVQPNSDEPTEDRTTWANGDFMVHDSADGSFRLQCTGPIRINGSTIDLNS